MNNENLNNEKLRRLVYILDDITNALGRADNEKIKTSLIESAKTTTKEILELLD